MPDVGRVDDSNQISGNDTKTVEALDDVFNEMDNFEETAAKVLYGLQNMDRTESPHLLPVTLAPSTSEMMPEFLNHANFAMEKNVAVSVNF